MPPNSDAFFANIAARLRVLTRSLDRLRKPDSIPFHHAPRPLASGPVLRVCRIEKKSAIPTRTRACSAEIDMRLAPSCSLRQVLAHLKKVALLINSVPAIRYERLIGLVGPGGPGKGSLPDEAVSPQNVLSAMRSHDDLAGESLS